MRPPALLDNATCQRCGISGWHPEARVCTAADCELRGGAAVKVDPDHVAGVSSEEAPDHV